MTSRVRTRNTKAELAGLQADLAELERSDPEVRAAGEKVDSIEDLLSRSSFGTPGARAVRKAGASGLASLTPEERRFYDEEMAELEAEISERPILFSGPMVCALLAGKKTQTRRVIKPQPVAGVRLSALAKGGLEDGHGTPIRARWCVGDRLWVRETWFVTDASEGKILYAANGEERRFPRGVAPMLSRHWWENNHRIDGSRKPRPSIFMPRWASRITLSVTRVRVQRVQDISAEDCIAEGIDPAPHMCGCETCSHTSALCSATASSVILAYAELWDSINGAKFPWKSNPWVWAVSFKVNP